MLILFEKVKFESFKGMLLVNVKNNK